MADYSTVPTVATGDLWTAGNHNLYLRDNIEALRPAVVLPIAGAFPPLSGVNAAALEVVESSGAGTAKPIFYQLRFDDTTDEGRIWVGVAIPPLSAAPVLKIHYRMAGANSSKAVRFACQIAAISSGDVSVNSKVFGTENGATIPVPDAANTESVGSITLSNADSLTAGDLYTIILFRDANHAGDTAAGDCIVTGVYIVNGG